MYEKKPWLKFYGDIPEQHRLSAGDDVRGADADGRAVPGRHRLRFLRHHLHLPAVRRRDRPVRRRPGRPRPEEGRPDHDLHAHLPAGDHLLLRRQQAGRRGEHDPPAVARQGDRVLPQHGQEPFRPDARRLLRKIQGGPGEDGAQDADPLPDPRLPPPDQEDRLQPDQGAEDPAGPGGSAGPLVERSHEGELPEGAEGGDGSRTRWPSSSTAAAPPASRRGSCSPTSTSSARGCRSPPGGAWGAGIRSSRSSPSSTASAWGSASTPSSWAGERASSSPSSRRRSWPT